MLKAKKSLGQNFLIDKNISKKIANIINIKNKEVIEIGPGTGLLTDEILNKYPKKLTIIEKDKQLYNFLIRKYQNIKKIEVINCDALKFDYNNILNSKIIISNLPYNISIKLIINWIKMNGRFNYLILMIQKEVAEKMKFKNNKKKNRLNYFIEITSEYNIEFNVSKNVFFPKPKINSSVIKIIPKKNLNINYQNLENFTKNIFKFKRKKLNNVLNIDKSKKNLIKELLDKRAEDLKKDELMKIFNYFYNY